MAKFQSSSWRSDEQLAAMLHDTSDWAVAGQRGQPLCSAASLGRAMERAVEYAASGAVVVAIRRLPSDDIIVFPEQIERLRKIIADREGKECLAA